jgi:hypothetical protein
MDSEAMLLDMPEYDEYINFLTCSELQVEYASEENASMVYTALSVDKEVSHDYGLQLYSPKLILFVLLYN